MKFISSIKETKRDNTKIKAIDKNSCYTVTFNR